MNADISYYSAKGGRDNNEDTVSVLESGSAVLALVADGLGGDACGENASRLAVSALNSELQNRPLEEGAMIQAITNANKTICDAQTDEVRMKTTIAALWIRKNTAIAANVGDSRIYQIRRGMIVYQSVDHSVAQMAVYGGLITSSQIRGYHDRNKLVRALGIGSEVNPDSKTLFVEPGDSFLLCSDGFWENIMEEEMTGILSRSANVSEWLKTMRACVEQNGGRGMDNHSAVAIRMF